MEMGLLKSNYYTFFKQYSLLIICLLCSVNSLFAQEEEWIYKYVDLPLLEVNHPTMINTLDSIVIKGTYNIDLQMELNSFFLFISRDPEWENTYLLEVWLFRTRDLDNRGGLGYFYVGNYPIIVSEKCYPKGLFAITSEKKRFDYKILKEPQMSTRDHPYWTFLYAENYIRYLDLPQFLVRRLGFKPCVNDSIQ